eukprot:NODE_8908_length_635_cov_26.414062_g8283_i0.p1 GENE.NODE_8908_length_635_cov_26.414062_g8283_i0~~NODE_8908_length_635_cov_26.414062_g8283_i0.p1  ORF type:complete len:169 (+),score=48.80 NODE_8908_length_635_cov_26.414062_g8283_i0:66-509(+)
MDPPSPEPPETPWMDKIKNPKARQAWNVAFRGLYRTYVMADKAGEKIAGVLGITDSRYQYAIDEYNRIQQRKKELEEQEILDAKHLADLQNNNTFKVVVENKNQVANHTPAETIVQPEPEDIEKKETAPTENQHIEINIEPVVTPSI